MSDGRRAHASTILLRQCCSPSISFISLHKFADGREVLGRGASAEMLPSPTGQIKIHGASARSVTLLPMLRPKVRL
jgi:hypothetical protein